jgi:putative ABC transport system permease protein
MRVRLYRALLHAYPAGFRRRFADELAAAFDAGFHAARRRGRLAAATYLALGAVDAVVNGLRERRSSESPHTLPAGDPLMTAFLSDMRFGVRLLVRNPRIAVLAIGTLAIGIGLAVSIYSVAHGALVKPLPFKDELRVVMMYEHAPQNGTIKGNVAPANFLDWRERSNAFSHMGGLRPFSGIVMSANGEAIRADGRRVLGDAFGALGLSATAGRLLTPADETAGAPIVVIADRMWRQHFGADPGIIGRSILLDERPHTVVGVLEPVLRVPGGPAGFDQIFVPWVLPPHLKTMRMSHICEAVARLKPGVTLEQAQADIGAVARALADQYPQSNKDESVLLTPVREALVGDVRPALLVLAGAVTLVLLLACANVASLLLARAAARRQEMSVRAAIGAGRTRLVRQLLAESLPIGIAAGGAGLGLSWWSLAWLQRVLPPEIAATVNARVDPTASIAALLLCIVTAVAFGLAPIRFVLGSSRGALRDPRGGVTAASGRRAMVVLQVALAVVLLIGAGLLTRSFGALVGIEPGFRTDGLLTFNVELPRSRYRGPDQWQPFFERLRDELHSIPGVTAAAGSSGLPLNENGGSVGFFAEGQAPPPDNRDTFVIYRLVTPGFFETLGIPMYEGRDFSRSDRPAGAPAVVIVNRTLAQRYWPGQSAIGKRVAFTSRPRPQDWATIVGVVGDIRHSSLAEPVDIQLYVPYHQEPNWYPPGQIVMRTQGKPIGLANAVRERVRAIDPMIPIAEIQTMEAIVGRAVAAPRFNMSLFLVLSLSSLALALVGIYGLLSFTVALRTREIGVRTALGADARSISRMIAGEGLRLTVAGGAMGLAAGAIAARSMDALLFKVEPYDPLTFAGCAALLLLVALVACYVPARRAARVDPVVALRD